LVNFDYVVTEVNFWFAVWLTHPKEIRDLMSLHSFWLKKFTYVPIFANLKLHHNNITIMHAV